MFPRSATAAFTALALGVASPASSAATNIDDTACEPGARLIFPRSRALEIMAYRAYVFDTKISGADLGDVPEESRDVFESLATEREAEYREILDALETLPRAEKDATLLTRLHDHLTGERPLMLVTTIVDQRFLELYLTALDDNGLKAQAGIMRDALGLYGPGARDPHKREAILWRSGKTLDKRLDAALARLEVKLAPLVPQIQQKAMALADANFPDEVDEIAATVDDETKLDWLVSKIFQCTSPTDLEDLKNPFTDLPQPQRDLVLMRLFMDEAMNGGVHQYFFNSTGDTAPALIEVLERRGLPEHARTIAEAMEIFGSPYPRQNQQRRRVMAMFTGEQDEFLHDLTYIADDGEIITAMIEIAKSSGLLAELTGAR